MSMLISDHLAPHGAEVVDLAFLVGVILTALAAMFLGFLVSKEWASLEIIDLHFLIYNWYDLA